jgi:hypothetical protein
MRRLMQTFVDGYSKPHARWASLRGSREGWLESLSRPNGGGLGDPPACRADEGLIAPHIGLVTPGWIELTNVE